jgi:hypothetical protein
MPPLWKEYHDGAALMLTKASLFRYGKIIQQSYFPHIPFGLLSGMIFMDRSL